MRAARAALRKIEAPDEPVETDMAEARREEERQARRALAEYFSILREWSLESRSDDVLAPDDTEKP